MKPIIESPKPNLLGASRVDFLKNPAQFDQIIYQKGYETIWEHAFPCPCKFRKDAQSTCLNCQGTGWVFGSAQKIKALITSINRDTKYKEWNTEMVGTISISVENRHQLAFMDRLTIVDSTEKECENLIIKKNNNGELFVFTIYPAKEIDFIFKFYNPTESLIRLNPSSYSIDDNKIIFNDEVDEKESITIKYTHNLSYVVLDIPHDIRNSYTLNKQSIDEQNLLPIQAIARKLHYVLDAKNFDGDNVLYNPTI